MKPLLLAFGLTIPTIVSGQEFHTPLEKGTIRDGQRIGIWEYFDTPLTKGLVVDYTKGEVLYIRPDTSKFYIYQSGSWVRKSLKSPPRPHYSHDLLNTHFHRGLDFIQINTEKEESIDVVLTFEVNENGEALNPIVEITVGTKGADRLKKQFVDLFNSLPNFWIAGVDYENNPVKSRLGIRWQVCTQCNKQLKSDFTLLGVYTEKIYKSDEDFNDIPREFTQERLVFKDETPIQYSPDESKILLHSRLFTPDGDKTDPYVAIFEKPKANLSEVHFGNIKKATWLNNSEIVFSYSYNTLRSDEVATYDVGANQKNPITIQNILNSNKEWEATLERIILHRDTSTTINLNTKSGMQIKWTSFFSNSDFIVDWSPAATHALTYNMIDGIRKFILTNCQTGSERTIPLINSYYGGWSQELNAIFMFQPKSPIPLTADYNLYKYDILNDELHELKSNLKSIKGARFNSSGNSFLLLMKENLYVTSIQDLEMGLNPNLVDENVTEASWNKTGNKLIYYNNKRKQIMEFDIKTKRTTTLLVWDTKKDRLTIP